MASRAALEIVLEARDDASRVLEGTTDGLADFSEQAEQAGEESERAAEGVDEASESVDLLGMALGAGAILGAGALFADLAQQAWQFSQDMDAAMNRVQVQTGASASELAAFRDVATDTFRAGYGQSVDEIARAMANVEQVTGETGAALEESTQKALTLSDALEMDVGESTAAVSSLMTNFGASSEEAFDLIVRGSQMGLNRMGDLSDTVREYSSDFSRLGFTAEETLQVMNAGLEAGAYNTDVVADGVREFGIRFSAAEDTAVEALEAIGVNTEDLYEQYEDGEVTVRDAMREATRALANVDDKTLRARAGAALFGAKWEDVGGDVFVAAGQAEEAIDGLAGASDRATEAMEGGLGPALQRFKRTTVASLAPMGRHDSALTKIVNTANTLQGEYSEVKQSQAGWRQSLTTLVPALNAVVNGGEALYNVLFRQRGEIPQVANAIPPYVERAQQMERAARGAGDGLQAQAEAADSSRMSLDELGVTSQSVASAFGQMTFNDQELWDLALASGASVESLALLAQQLGIATDAEIQHTIKAKALVAMFGEGEISAQQLKAAFDDLESSHNVATVAADESLATYESLRDGLHENEGLTLEHIESVRGLGDEMVDTGQRSDRLDRNLGGLTGTTSRAERATMDFHAALSDAGYEAEAATRDVDGYSGALRDVPRDVRTDFDYSGLEQAEAAAEETRSAIEDIPGNIDVSVDYSESNRPWESLPGSRSIDIYYNNANEPWKNIPSDLIMDISTINSSTMNTGTINASTIQTYGGYTQGLARGTPHWMGGLTLVGEAGPEIVDLPQGSRVYSNTRSRMLAQRSGGGGQRVVYQITNHFGRGSVRSERDIRRIAQEIERSKVLRGGRMIA